MVLKLTTGSRKGASLASTKSARQLRPTQSLDREALINTTQHLLDFAQLDVLDLYAGIGTVGLEFISSGVRSVVFVERDPICIKTLRANIKKLGFEDKATILAKALPKGLSGLAAQSFGLIFADPPYADDSASTIIKEILGKDLLAEGGYLIWETAANSSCKTALEEAFGLKLVKHKSYGDTELYIFQR